MWEMYAVLCVCRKSPSHHGRDIVEVNIKENGSKKRAFRHTFTNVFLDLRHQKINRKEERRIPSPLLSPAEINYKVLSQDFRVFIREVACCSPWLMQSIGEGDVHRGNLARRPTRVMVPHPIEKEVANVVLQL
ncbi:hypothetical protein TNCV_3288381 [Trichonephila clavipes]|nr:hypothetical protein TNCV_3288381 [Trichonephila clavipes]